MAIKETLDTKVVKILFDYYTNNPGEEQMVITDLYDSLPDEEPGKIHAAILTLQKKGKKGWVGCDLTTDGLTGTVWIEPEGIKVMSPQKKTAIIASHQPDTKPVLPSEAGQALIPEFQYDTFVSYTEQDDHTWIKDTLETVRGLMNVQFRKSERPPRWVEHVEWTPQARKDAGASAAFLIVFSQHYLESAWGQQGETGFLQVLRQHIHRGGKVFLLNIDQTALPESLCKATIHKFAREAAADWAQSQLWQLCQDISKELQRLLKSPAAREQLLNKPSGLAYKSVLLEHAPVDQRLAANVAQRLNQFGIEYVSPPIASGMSSENRKEFEEQVLSSDGLLLVYGVAPQDWLLRKVQQMYKIFAAHQQSRAFAIYNGPPPGEKIPGTLRFRGVLIDCKACQSDEQDCEQCPGKREFLKFVDLLKEEPPHASNA